VMVAPTIPIPADSSEGNFGDTIDIDVDVIHPVPIALVFSGSDRFNTAQAVNTAHEVFTASTQVNATYSTNIDNLSDVVICSFFASQPNSPQLVHEDLKQIHLDDMEEMDLR
nr:hypothetical protein [Tanacetum cinerariifolium]